MQTKMEDKSMTRKLNLLWISAGNKIRNFVEEFKNEEEGIAEIVAIVLIILIVVGVAATFNTNIGNVVENVFGKLTNFVDHN